MFKEEIFVYTRGKLWQVVILHNQVSLFIVFRESQPRFFYFFFTYIEIELDAKVFFFFYSLNPKNSKSIGNILLLFGNIINKLNVRPEVTPSKTRQSQLSRISAVKINVRETKCSVK